MDIEGILAIFFIFGGGTLFLLAISPVGKALAERIRGRAPAAADSGQLDGVLDELERVRRELAELQERMDFAERLLAKQREAERLAPPRSA